MKIEGIDSFWMVRHGQSTANRDGLHQCSTEPLSEKGQEQAHLLAKTLVETPDIEFSEIISSTDTRAKLTARLIEQEYSKNGQVKPISYTRLLREQVDPLCIQGTRHENPLAEAINRLRRENYGDPKYHHSIDAASLKEFGHSERECKDEENLADFYKRVSRFTRRFANLDSESVPMIVSHGETIKMLIWLSQNGTPPDPSTYLDHLKRYIFPNSAVMRLDRQKGGLFKLATWDDGSFYTAPHLKDRADLVT
jgi:broad specificity phosphatase PhoE